MQQKITTSLNIATRDNINEEDDPPSSSFAKTETAVKEPAKGKGSFLGSLKYIENQIEIVSDIDRCFQLWQEFSPQETLFDTWEFRFAFYLGYKHQPYFILLKNQVENLALLPLWYENDTKQYFWFGSAWQEEVSFFSKNLKYIPLLLSAAPSPLLLNAISKTSGNRLPANAIAQFQEDKAKYVLRLKGLGSHEDYLMTLKKNTRRNLRKDRNKIRALNPQIVFNDFSNFDTLVKLSKKRFKQKGDEADWEDTRRVESFRQVINLAGKSYRIRMIAIKIGEKTVGVDLNVIFHQTYYTLKCGYNVKDFSGIGNFMNLLEIDDAISLGMKKIDLLQNNYEWKAKLFEAVPLFKYEK